jgi:hypothetical protein
MRLHEHLAIAAITVFAISAAPVACFADAAAPAKDATVLSDDGTKSGSSSEPLSDKLDRSGGVIKPPMGVDPALAKAPPAAGPKSTPIIPPLGGPGGPPGVTAK